MSILSIDKNQSFKGDNMKKLLLAAFTTSILLTGCFENPADGDNSKSTLPTGNFTFEQMEGESITTTSSFGVVISSDTSNMDLGSDEISTIVTITSDSMISYDEGEDEDATYRTSAPMSASIFGDDLDTSAIADMFEENGFADFEILEYSVTEKSTTFSNDTLTMNSGYKIRYSFASPEAPGVKVEMEIISEGKMTLISYDGDIPPFDWPQDIVNEEMYGDEISEDSDSRGRVSSKILLPKLIYPFM
jgi:hypothetical protein